jgi:hypothetical protein
MVNPNSSMHDFSKDMLRRYVRNGLDKAATGVVGPGGFRDHSHTITRSEVAGSRGHQQPSSGWHTTACCHFDSRATCQLPQKTHQAGTIRRGSDGHYH